MRYFLQLLLLCFIAVMHYSAHATTTTLPQKSYRPCPAGMVYTISGQRPTPDCYCPYGQRPVSDIIKTNFKEIAPFTCSSGGVASQNACPLYRDNVFGVIDTISFSQFGGCALPLCAPLPSSVANANYSGTPRAIDGLILWLDGNDPSNGTQPPTGSQIMTWIDKSGQTASNNATSVNTTTGIVYNSNVLNGNGVMTFKNQAMSISNSPTFINMLNAGKEINIYMVMRVSPTTGNATQSAFGSSGPNNFELDYTTNTLSVLFNGKPNTQISHNYQDSNFYIMSARILVNGASDARIQICSYNGSTNPQICALTSSPMNTASPSITSFYIGGTNIGGTMQNLLNGDIAEILIYQAPLPTNQQQGILTYLLQKWFQTGFDHCSY